LSPLATLMPMFHRLDHDKWKAVARATKGDGCCAPAI
jgi:hypothetical protein